MSTYEADHNISSRNTNESNHEDNTRTQLSLAQVIESFLQSDETAQTGTPEEVFASALRTVLAGADSDFLESLQSEEFSTKKGIPDEYIDSLERVKLLDLSEDDDCPICTNRYIDDKYPLIVKLPCHAKTKHKGHIFDLECIGPWLKMNSTCPLCRFDLLEADKKRKEKLEQELKEIREQEEEEEEDWDVYG